MRGHKNVAIVPEDCSSGISLQADSRVNNQRTRVYITLELPSSVEVAIQQFCSTHRCNQVCNPEYILLYSNLTGEEKFASNNARRLTSFALRSVSTFQAVLDHNNGSNPIVPPPSDNLGKFFSDVKTVLVGAGLMAIDDTNTLKLQRKTSV
ncbi:hypothetical protein DAPPUDRAFT_329697 [Daphnia pulex]|uniref:Strawberry notch helicase C domain-containing protein n=1 Tax=Daphnia pulex TaxID=6669 RepID=E9HHD1_DAPPU|nr:hypothetical protein DAPPUDRAFT_329697 [Daphnia pulex]|eukprot:EFX68863.1 hypothetical protein DAPPUDRAFT_329697 [Daphnia pulex]